MGKRERGIGTNWQKKLKNICTVFLFPNSINKPHVLYAHLNIAGTSSVEAIEDVQRRYLQYAAHA